MDVPSVPERVWLRIPGRQPAYRPHQPAHHLRGLHAGPLETSPDRRRTPESGEHHRLEHLANGRHYGQGSLRKTERRANAQYVRFNGWRQRQRTGRNGLQNF